VWVVGSQQGHLRAVDDCIIHGIYNGKQAAMQCVLDLQRAAPADVFGLIPMRLDSRLDVGFSLNHDWRWYEPKEPTPEPDDGGWDVGSDFGSSVSSDASLVRAFDRAYKRLSLDMKACCLSAGQSEPPWRAHSPSKRLGK
jgi:hypothetical protein